MGQFNSKNKKSPALHEPILTPPPMARTLSVRSTFCAQLDSSLEHNGSKEELHDYQSSVFLAWLSAIRSIASPAERLQDSFHALAVLLLPDIPDTVKVAVVREFASVCDLNQSEYINMFTHIGVVGLHKMADPKTISSRLCVIEALTSQPLLLHVKDEADSAKLINFLLFHAQAPEVVLRLVQADAIAHRMSHTLRLAMVLDSATELSVYLLDHAPSTQKLVTTLCVTSFSEDGGDSSDDEEKEESSGNAGVVQKTTHSLRSRSACFLALARCKKAPAVWKAMQNAIERLVQSGCLLGHSDKLLNILHLAAVRDDTETLAWLDSLHVFDETAWKNLLASGNCGSHARQWLVNWM